VPTPHARAAGEVVANFASGCLWCVESDFGLAPGVIRTISGYTGGKLKDPTYRQVSAGNSGHIKSVRIYFDPKKTS
jgi:peptide methionine sulfoxide reductase MsrA